jgi:hypothetical protein
LNPVNLNPYECDNSQADNSTDDDYSAVHCRKVSRAIQAMLSGLT